MDGEIIAFGLRIDGRRPEEIRKIQYTLNTTDADGSVEYKQGNTHILVSISGPKQGKHETCTIRPRLAMARFCTMSNRRRYDNDKRMMEFERELKDILEGNVIQESLNNSEIDVNVLVLVDDGSVEAAVINACSLGLMNAGIPIKDYLIACTSGCVEDTAIVDLNDYESKSRALITEYIVAISSRSKDIVYLSYDDIGGHKLNEGLVEKLTKASIEGCDHIVKAINE